MQVNGRLFICGDIHGMYDLLMKALQGVGFVQGHDTLVCCGDLVDRGPDSRKVLDFFLDDETNSYFAVRGNHDQFLYMKDYNTAAFNGGNWWFNFPSEVINSYVAKIRAKMPVYLDIHTPFSRYGVVHAEVPYNFRSWDDFITALDDTSGKRVGIETMALWSRDVIRNNQGIGIVEDVDLVFHGHTVVKEPLLVHNRVYIDTGAVFSGGKLTVVEVCEDEFHYHFFHN